MEYVQCNNSSYVDIVIERVTRGTSIDSRPRNQCSRVVDWRLGSSISIVSRELNEGVTMWMFFLSSCHFLTSEEQFSRLVATFTLALNVCQIRNERHTIRRGRKSQKRSNEKSQTLWRTKMIDWSA